jgi:PST family polysaccharide transporter
VPVPTENINAPLEPGVVEPPGIAATARSAVYWNTGFNLFRDALQFGLMLVLVRLVDRSAYGEFTLVTSIIGFVAVISFNNFLAYTLQVRTEAETHYQDHFTAGGAFQLAAFLATNLLAFVFARVPSFAPVAPLLHVMSVSFLLDWPVQLRCRMLERAFDWKRLRLLHATGLMGSSALAIVMAANGANAYALLVPGLFVPLPFIVELFVVQRWRPTWAWSWQRYRPAWKFGLSRTASGVLVTSRQLTESIALAAVLGFSGFGIYNRAVALAIMFCVKFATQLMTAIYPVLTRIGAQHHRAGAAGDLVLRLVWWSVVPIGTLFGLFAEPVVRAVYGEKWLPITPLLPWTMALGALMATAHAGYMLLLANQQAKKCLIADAVALAGTGLALAVALNQRTVGYIIALTIVQGILVCILAGWLLKSKAVTPPGIRAAFLPALVAATVAAGLVLTVRAMSGTMFVNVGATAALGIGALLVYVAALRVLFRGPLVELVRYFPAQKIVNGLLVLSRPQPGGRNP